MSILDAHVHLYPEEVNQDPLAWAKQRAETHWAILCTRRRKNGQSVQAFPTVAQLLKDMDAAGVERSLLLGWYWQWPETCQIQNAFYARCVKEHPDRLSAFATVNPAGGREPSLDLVRRARDQGFCGLGELSPHSQGFDIADPLFLELVELAGDLKLPVNFHVTEHDTGQYPGRVETPLRDFLWIAHKMPHTNFILSHWGALLPLKIEEAEDCYNLFYDTAASPLIYGETIWKKFLEVVPIERIIFGSDYPLNLYPQLETVPSMTRFVAEAKEQGVDLAVLAKNARRVLHLA